MTLARTTAGVNKAEEAGTAHWQIMSVDVLQRVLPTMVARYLGFCGWIRQDIWCDRMSETFLDEATGTA